MPLNVKKYFKVQLIPPLTSPGFKKQFERTK